jgi:DNA primase
LAKDSIKKNKLAVMVEGNFDLITPFQAGLTNIVATMGTALTPAQCKLLSRYCDTIVLAFDADAAGGSAAERSAELLLGQGLKVKVAVLRGGKDPDEIIRQQGKEAFSACLDASLPYLEFKIRRVAARHNLAEIEGRSSALREIAPLLGRESDGLTQKEYAKFTAELLKSDVDTVLVEISRNRHYQHFSAGSARRMTAKPSSKYAEAEKNLLSLAAQNLEALKYLKAELSVDDFRLKETRPIAELLLTADFTDDARPAHFLLENLPDEEAKKYLARLLVSDHLSGDEQMETIIKDCVKVMREERQQEKIAHLKTAIKEAEGAGETGRASELLITLKSEIS